MEGECGAGGFLGEGGNVDAEDFGFAGEEEVGGCEADAAAATGDDDDFVVEGGHVGCGFGVGRCSSSVDKECL